MAENITNVKERILQLIEYKGLAKENFFKKIGVSYGNFKGISKNSAPSTDILVKISSEFPDANIEWLVTGEGDMLKPTKEDYISLTPLKKGVAKPIDEQLVPLYEPTATASIMNVFLDRSTYQPIDHIRIPNMPKCDGAIHITGDSMYPLLKSGDIVLYKEGFDKDYILWGDIYLVYVTNAHGEEIFAIKYLKKSEKEGYIRLVSYNDHHAPQEYPIENLKKWALVKASIRINAS